MTFYLFSAFKDLTRSLDGIGRFNCVINFEKSDFNKIKIISDKLPAQNKAQVK